MAKILGKHISSDQNWKDFIPTGSWTANTTYTGKYCKNRDNAEIQVLVALSGAPNSTALQVNLPPGLSIDTSKIMSANPDLDAWFGSVRILDASILAYSGGALGFATATSVGVFALASSNAYANPQSVTQAVPFALGSGDAVAITFSIPILGWSASDLFRTSDGSKV